jgi:hypothetical protein
MRPDRPNPAENKVLATERAAVMLFVFGAMVDFVIDALESRARKTRVGWKDTFCQVSDYGTSPDVSNRLKYNVL